MFVVAHGGKKAIAPKQGERWFEQEGPAGQATYESTAASTFSAPQSPPGSRAVPKRHADNAIFCAEAPEGLPKESQSRKACRPAERSDYGLYGAGADASSQFQTTNRSSYAPPSEASKPRTQPSKEPQVSFNPVTGLRYLYFPGSRSMTFQELLRKGQPLRLLQSCQIRAAPNIPTI